MRKIEAIFCSDIHASSNAPIFRCNEPDWFAAMKRPLDELKRIQEQNGNPPVIIAGDIFDIPKPSPDIINFLLKELPDNVYAIPGQHDLPYHNFEDIGLSSFETLVLSGKIRLLSRKPLLLKNSRIFGFPWNFEIEQPEKNDGRLNVAVVHKYIWIPKHNYIIAPESNNINNSFFKKALKNFDLAIFGDNHSGFESKVWTTTVYNCGCFMRRKQDEISYDPAIGLFTDDGEIERHYLNCTKDKYSSITKQFEAKEFINTTDFVKELSGMSDIDLDIDNCIKKELNKQDVNDGVRKFITELMEDVK